MELQTAERGPIQMQPQGYQKQAWFVDWFQQAWENLPPEQAEDLASASGQDENPYRFKLKWLRGFFEKVL